MNSVNPLDIDTLNAKAEDRTAKRTVRKPRPSQRPEKPSQPVGCRKQINPAVAFFTAPRTRMMLGVILAVLCVVTLIVSISYLKSGIADQSTVHEMSPREIVDSGQHIENVGGPAGATLAHLLLVNGLGLGSFVLVFYLGCMALSLFGIMKLKFWAFTFRCLFTGIALSVILGLFTYNLDSTINWGGNHGHYINQWLMQYGDALLAYAVSVMLIGLLVVMYLTQITAIARNMNGRISKAREAMSDAASRARHPEHIIAEVPEADSKAPAAAPNTEVSRPKAMTLTSEPEPAKKPVTDIGFTIDDEEPSHEASAAEADGKKPQFIINAAVLGESHAKADENASDPHLAMSPYSIRDELSHYRFPGIDLLIDRPVTNEYNPQEQEDNKNMIIDTLQSYGIQIARVEATVGPTVTLYEIVPAEGVRIAQIKRLEEDIARSLEALGIRIIAPIRGKSTVGIEVPNRTPQIVSMRNIINSQKYRDCRMELPRALGATISNDVFIADLTKMPHLLVAGATGQGKSVGLNCIIASLLYKKHPGELKFVLIDPKMVEFSLYSQIENHYLAKLPNEEEPIITEPSKALQTLSALCVEMDNRYEMLRKAGVRNIKEYNDKFCRRVLNPEKGHRFMPYIVIIVDEFADLIMVAGKDISLHIARIAQKARAVGMHMIIAPQRPSTDVITGIIKANFPARLAFRTSSSIDSRTILDCPGANQLIGMGDMLFSHNSMMERVQCAFIDTPEVENLVEFISRQTAYPSPYLLPEPESDKNTITPGSVDLSKRDELFDDCARFLAQNPTASVSLLQRRFAIGYNKAGKIMDQLEAAGIVGPADGQKPRAVLVTPEALETLLATL